MSTFHRRSSRTASTTLYLCLCVMTATIFVLIDSVTSSRRLDVMLRAYERVSLSPIDDKIFLNDDEAGGNWKLAARDRAPIHLTVTAFSRSFDVTLRRGQSVYVPDAKIIIHDADDGSSIELLASEFGSDSVEGYIIGDPDSYVHGQVINGIFDGIISTAYENYYVEPASKFLDDDLVEADVSYDAVVYRESDVNFSPNVRPRRRGSKVQHVGGTALGMLDAERSSGGNWSSVFNETSTSEEYIKDSSWEPTLPNDASMSDVVEADLSAQKKTGRVCKVKAVVDHTFYRIYARANIRKAIGHVEFHVREADRMFSVTDFNSDGRPDGIRVRLAALEVFKSKTDKGYLLSDEIADATVYLQKFTIYSHDGMCAAMAFTHRPFKDDVLGYAYRGGPNHAGGICYPRRSVNGKMRSLNVGLTSTNAPWGTLAVAQSVIVVTHELGHMFGAMHDEDADEGICFHANRQRHYIMSAMANPGKSVINRQFSKCSRAAIQKNMLVNGKCLICRGRECGGVAVTATFHVLVSLPLALITLRWTSFYF